MKSPENSAVLQRIGGDERRHYEKWKVYTQTSVRPNRLKVVWYTLLGRLLGVTFALKLMEQGEESAQENYADLVTAVPEAEAILAR